MSERRPSPFKTLFDSEVCTLIEATKRIKLGTGTVNMPNNHPAAVAANAAMLDHLLDGRFILGISPGGLLSDAEVFGNLDQDRNAMFGIPIPFTVLKGHEYVEDLLEREELVNVQLPQKFDRAALAAPDTWAKADLFLVSIASIPLAARRWLGSVKNHLRFGSR